MKKLQPSEVIRVHTRTGSHIEPTFEDGWDEPTRLAWHAAVVAHDTGLDIGVYTGGVRRRRARRWWRPRPRWKDVPDVYGIQIDSSTLTPVTYATAWDFLVRVSVGAARTAARADSTAAGTPSPDIGPPEDTRR